MTSTSFTTAQDPVPEGKDQSGMPKQTPAPAAGGVEQPEAAPSVTAATPPAAAVKPRTAGKVTIYAVPPMGTMTIPPLEEGGDPVVIDRYGTEVDEVTAQRAYEAAASAGFTIRED